LKRSSSRSSRSTCALLMIAWPGTLSSPPRSNKSFCAFSRQARIAARVTKAAIGAADVERLEGAIDRLEDALPPLRRFILPGGSAAGSLLHLARTVCRRAERRVIGLGADAVEPIVVVYLNRLSDLLFVMARSANHRAGVPETEW